MATNNIIQRLRNLAPLEWRNIDEVRHVGELVLREIAENKDNLNMLLENVRSDPKLFSMGAHFDRIDQIVLYDDLTKGIRIRLHIYPQKHFDGPHNHRWSFSSFILNGSYCHRIFGCDQQIDQSTNMFDLEATFVMQQGVGSSYTLHHSVIHSVNAMPDTVSLIIRGPAEKQRLMMTDITTGRLKWKYGVIDELPEEIKLRSISSDYFEVLLSHLKRLNLI